MPGTRPPNRAVAERPGWHLAAARTLPPAPRAEPGSGFAVAWLKPSVRSRRSPTPAWPGPRPAPSPRTLRVHPALQTLSVDLSPFLQCKPPFRGAGSSYLSLPPETLSDPTPPCPLSTQSTAGTSFILGDLAQTSWLALSIAPPPPPSRHHPFSFYYQNHA